MDLILVAVVSLGAIGLIAAVILYVASKKFAVYEDPRIAQVAEVLPQANCGGCGFPVLILLAALFITMQVSGEDSLLSALVALGAVVPYYLIIYMCRNKLSKTFSFTIEK